MPTWPTDLPCRAIANTLQTSIEPNVSEFKPDVGRPQRSRRYTQSRRPYSFEISVTSEQKAVLEEFFEIECAMGVRSFTMRDLADLSATPATKSFTFAAPPSCSQMAPNRFRAMISIVREN